MKKRIVFTLLFCMAWIISAHAQQTIESIRKAYQDVHETIAKMTMNEEGMYEIPPQYFDLHVEQNLPATGPHHEYIRMFFGEEEQDEESEDYSPYPPHFLRFATAKYNFAVREFYEEYLYDEKGNIMFIYIITPDVEDDMMPYELRMWFDGERLLRFTAKRKEEPLDYIDIATLSKATFKEVFSGKTIPEKYERETGRCQLRAKRFLELFESIDNRTYL